MIEALLSILIVLSIMAGAYYASHYVVQLRHNRDAIADELQRATGHIEELESRIIMLESERDIKAAQMESKGLQPNGWDSLRG